MICFEAFSQPPLNWSAARHSCIERGGVLAEVIDNPTLQYVRGVVNPGDGLYWLGATGVDEQGRSTSSMLVCLNVSEILTVKMAQGLQNLAKLGPSWHQT